LQLTLVAISSPFLKIAEQLETRFSSGQHNFSSLSRHVLPGKSFCARYSEGGQWYRAEIRSVEADGSWALVYFVDYGFEKTVPASDLFQADSAMCELPAQAVKCALYNCRPRGASWTAENKEHFAKRVLHEQLLAQFIERRDATYTVHLFTLAGQSINRELYGCEVRPVLTNSFLYRETLTSLTAPPFPPPGIDVGVVERISTSFVCHPGEIFCHLLRLASDLRRLRRDLNRAYRDGGVRKPKLEDPRVGVACAALYQNVWYRACVVDVEIDALVLFLVDYGNVERVAFDDVRLLEDEFVKLPCQVKGVTHIAADSAADSAARVPDRKFFKTRFT
jgi:hypothetical protein